jgi:PAS domain S-box-containing protein
MRTEILPADAHVLQVLSHLSDGIARATELSDMYDAALDALRDGLGLDRSSILLFDSQDVMRFVAWRGLSDTYRAAVEGHTPWRPDSVDAQPVCVPDVERAPDLASYKPIFVAEGIAALAFIPLLARGRVLGKFMCYYAAPHDFGAGEIALALAIGQQVAFAVERTRTSEALRRNEKRLRYALDSARMGTWEWDLGTNTVDWSDNLAAIHGLPAGAFDGTFAAYEREIHPDDRARVFESITRAVNDDVPHDVEYRIVSPLDGTVRWVEGKGHVERGPDGKAMRMAGICMDITRRKLAELERAELASRAGFLADVSTALVRSLDYTTTLRAVAHLAVPRIADWCSVHLRRDDGTIEDLATAHAEPERLEWIRAHPELFRVHPTDRFGVGLALRTNRSLLYADVSDAQLSAIVNTPALRRALRTVAVRSAIVVPIRTSGDVVGAMTFLITGESARRFTPDDLSLAEEVALRAGVAVENGRLYTAAHEANRLKDEFLATLSHELRTPLNAMLGWARMLEQGHVSAERLAHAVAIIRRNAEGQARLISDILDVARITSDKLHLDPQIVDVSDTMRLTVEGIESQAVASGVSLTLSAEPDLMAWADPARLQQMAWNLLSNAIKFTPAGGRVEADVRRMRDRIRVQVTDTGIGIGPEFLPHLFERFRQADASTTRAHGGLGLGLAITRHLAELQGGSVEAESDGLGRGARFAVYLPLVRSAAPRRPPARDARPGIPVVLTGRRVLAVDDDEDARHLVCEVLTLAGARVQPAKSVAEALGALDRGAFDLVVADIAMPIEDGFTLIERLSTATRGNGLPPVPVIAVTAYAREEDRARALAAGFSAHVAKPIDASSLIDTAATLLARQGA